MSNLFVSRKNNTYTLLLTTGRVELILKQNISICKIDSKNCKDIIFCFNNNIINFRERKKSCSVNLYF